LGIHDPKKAKKLEETNRKLHADDREEPKL
jgi:hypothetical protein